MRRTVLQPADLEDFDLVAFNDMTLSDDEAKDKVFARANEECLHGPPIQITARSRRGNSAWVVFNGRKVGVFETWAVTSAQISGFPSASQIGYRTREDAQAAWDHARANHSVGPPGTSGPAITAVSSVLPSSIRIPPPSNSLATAPQCSGSVHTQNTSVPISRALPQVEVPRSPSPTQVMPTAPSQQYQPLPSVPVTPTRSVPVTPIQPSAPVTPRRILTRQSPAIPKFGLSDEAAYWVVTSGANPGVYLGKDAAFVALGSHSPRRLTKAGSREQAERAFASSYMRGDVVEVYEE